jgi:hypothetical protein
MGGLKPGIFVEVHDVAAGKGSEQGLSDPMHWKGINISHDDIRHSTKGISLLVFFM